jgi:hypothetical protein
MTIWTTSQANNSMMTAVTSNLTKMNNKVSSHNPKRRTSDVLMTFIFEAKHFIELKLNIYTSGGILSYIIYLFLLIFNFILYVGLDLNSFLVENIIFMCQSFWICSLFSSSMNYTCLSFCFCFFR